MAQDNVKFQSSEFLINLGNNIRYYRKQNKFSQENLAELANINSKYLGDVERGIVNISIEKLNKIAQALNISLGVLLGYTREEENSLITEINILLTRLDELQLKKIHKIIKIITD